MAAVGRIPVVRPAWYGIGWRGILRILVKLLIYNHWIKRWIIHENRMSKRKLPEFTQKWTNSMTEEWEERAAIMEHDGGMQKAEAEKHAMEIIAKKYLLLVNNQQKLSF